MGPRDVTVGWVLAEAISGFLKITTVLGAFYLRSGFLGCYGAWCCVNSHNLSFAKCKRPSEKREAARVAGDSVCAGLTAGPGDSGEGSGWRVQGARRPPPHSGRPRTACRSGRPPSPCACSAPWRGCRLHSPWRQEVKVVGGPGGPKRVTEPGWPPEVGRAAPEAPPPVPSVSEAPQTRGCRATDCKTAGILSDTGPEDVRPRSLPPPRRAPGASCAPDGVSPELTVAHFPVSGRGGA